MSRELESSAHPEGHSSSHVQGSRRKMRTTSVQTLDMRAKKDRHMNDPKISRRVQHRWQVAARFGYSASPSLKPLVSPEPETLEREIETGSHLISYACNGQCKRHQVVLATMCAFLRSEMGFTLVDVRPETNHVGAYGGISVMWTPQSRAASSFVARTLGHQTARSRSTYPWCICWLRATAPRRPRQRASGTRTNAATEPMQKRKKQMVRAPVCQPRYAICAHRLHHHRWLWCRVPARPYTKYVNEQHFLDGNGPWKSSV
jgi:hypothetical protein